MIKLAIVSPCYNEEEVLEDSAARLTALFDELVAKEKISADSFVLFVNDGSKDRTWSIIKKLHGTNPSATAYSVHCKQCPALPF